MRKSEMKEPAAIGFEPKAYVFEFAKVGKHPVIWVRFPHDAKLREALQRAAKVKWVPNQMAWCAADNTHHRALFGLPPKAHTNETLEVIHEVNRPAFEKYVQEMRLRAYSLNTIRTYCTEFSQLLKILGSHRVDALTAERIRSYLLYCINTLKLSENQIHSRINAIKFYFEQVLHQDKLFIEIPRPQKPSLLPKVLSTKDISKMFEQVENPKHLLLLKLCYGMGLRVSELVQLKISDIDSGRMQVLVRSGKGKKDRYVVLPQSILALLRTYYKSYKPKEFLFEGQYGGAYAVRSVQATFKRAMKKARIYKPVGVHSLRHSYATRLMESGVDMRYVQELSGHNDIPR